MSRSRFFFFILFLFIRLDQTEKLFPLSESPNQQCQLEKHDNDFVESEVETINNHILPSQHVRFLSYIYQMTSYVFLS